MSKSVTCKKCGTVNLVWSSASGRWALYTPHPDGPIGFVAHECPVREIKEVGCKYCPAKDLWWSKEKMEDGSTKNVLMESFGLPHSCDERKKHFEKLSQAKKDEYAKEKARIYAIPDNSACGICVHGRLPGVNIGYSCTPARCTTCGGSGRISAKLKQRWLYEARKRIWPHIGSGGRR